MEWRRDFAASRHHARWFTDFMWDATERRGRSKALTVVDCYTSEHPATRVDTSLPDTRVVRAPEPLPEKRGLPGEIPMDNEPEFASRALDARVHRYRVKLRYIEPGKPMQNPLRGELQWQVP